MCVSRSVVSVSMTSWTVAHQVPLSKGFFRQEYWSIRLLIPKLQRLSQHLRKLQSKGCLLKFGWSVQALSTSFASSHCLRVALQVWSQLENEADPGRVNSWRLSFQHLPTVRQRGLFPRGIWVLHPHACYGSPHAMYGSILCLQGAALPQHQGPFSQGGHSQEET